MLVSIANAQVHCLVRKNAKLEQLQRLAPAAKIVVGDLEDADLLKEQINWADYVVHAAALVAFDSKKDKLIQRVNVDATATLVNIAIEYGVKKFCFISSIAAIGRGDTELNLDETNQWQDTKELPFYTKSKYLAEQEVWRGIAEGLPAVIVNPSVVLGVGDWNRSSLQIFNYFKTKNPFYPTGTINYVDIRDVAEITSKLLLSDITAERFILNAGAIPYKDFLEQLATSLGEKAPSKPLPKWLHPLLWRADATRATLTGSERKITADLIKSATKKHQYNSDKIRNTLNFSFRPLEETLAWVKEHY